jgi:hypothetical protein
MAQAESRLKQPARPPTRGSFKPGQSGNPGGKKPKTEEERTLEAMCREKTPQALGVILRIMEAGENERNQLGAAQYVIDRGWGKATQNISAALTVTVEDFLKSVRSS